MMKLFLFRFGALEFFYGNWQPSALILILECKIVELLKKI